MTLLLFGEVAFTELCPDPYEWGETQRREAKAQDPGKNVISGFFMDSIVGESAASGQGVI